MSLGGSEKGEAVSDTVVEHIDPEDQGPFFLHLPKH